jgi:hypothetical protein
VPVRPLPMTLLRGEYALRGVPAVPDDVLVDIVDEIFLPLVAGRGCGGTGICGR